MRGNFAEARELYTTGACRADRDRRRRARRRPRRSIRARSSSWPATPPRPSATSRRDYRPARADGRALSALDDGGPAGAGPDRPGPVRRGRSGLRPGGGGGGRRRRRVAGARPQRPRTPPPGRGPRSRRRPPRSLPRPSSSHGVEAPTIVADAAVGQRPRRGRTGRRRRPPNASWRRRRRSTAQKGNVVVRGAGRRAAGRARPGAGRRLIRCASGRSWSRARRSRP